MRSPISIEKIKYKKPKNNIAIAKTRPAAIPATAPAMASPKLDAL